MYYRPRMEASVKSIVLLQDLNYLQYERMVVDHWQVEAKPGACGEYVSPDPRFVVFFDGAAMTIDRGNGHKGISCGACYVPAGMVLCGSVANAGYLEHIDIHIEAEHLRRIVGPSVELEAPRFLTGSAELRNLASLLADECRTHSRPAGYGEALAAGVIHEIFHLGDKIRTADSAPAWLDQVMDHVAGALDRRLTMEELAGVAGIPCRCRGGGGGLRVDRGGGDHQNQHQGRSQQSDGCRQGRVGSACHRGRLTSCSGRSRDCHPQHDTMLPKVDKRRFTPGSRPIAFRSSRRGPRLRPRAVAHWPGP